jgi:hypothetical protein
MKQVKIGFENFYLEGLLFKLTPAVTNWLIAHKVEDYRVRHEHLYDRPAPVIEFGDNVPDEIINWFILRWL